MTTSTVPATIAVGELAPVQTISARFEHAWLIVLGCHLAIGMALDALGVANLFRPHLWGDRFAIQLLWLLLAVWPFLLALELWRRTPRRALDPSRIGRAFLACIGVLVLFKTHSNWKAAIAETGFAWDARLALLDASLHFGREPWTLIPQVPQLTVFLDRAYSAWYTVLAVILSWQAWSADRPRRAQFFLALAITVVVQGAWLAHALSSAGPCFYAHVVPGPDPFAGLLAYLREVNTTTSLNSLRGHAVLWTVHAKGLEHSWYLISAMPSLHVAYAVLWALVGWRANRVLGGVLWAYAAVILVGTVALAWHYAIDGYVAALGAIVAWSVAGRLIRS